MYGCFVALHAYSDIKCWCNLTFQKHTQHGARPYGIREMLKGYHNYDLNAFVCSINVCSVYVKHFMVYRKQDNMSRKYFELICC